MTFFVRPFLKLKKKTGNKVCSFNPFYYTLLQNKLKENKQTKTGNIFCSSDHFYYTLLQKKNGKKNEICSYDLFCCIPLKVKKEQQNKAITSLHLTFSIITFLKVLH